MKRFEKIKIIPTYNINIAELKVLSENLYSIFTLPVLTGNSVNLPEGSYNKYRRQFNSSIILERLRHLIELGSVTLIITNVDLYAPGLNFVFGEANTLTPICIISTNRLWFDIDGNEVSYNLFNLRMLKEAVHEIGHVMGLRHCQNYRCVMYFSNSIVDTDRKGKYFCEQCKRRLGLDTG